MTKKARFRYLVKKHKVLYLLMLPGILYYIIFKYVPMYGIIIAFQDFSIGKGILGSKFVGLKHFIEFFYVTPDSWKLIRNTIMLNVYDLLFHFPSPIILPFYSMSCATNGSKDLSRASAICPTFSLRSLSREFSLPFCRRRPGWSIICS